MNSLGFQLLMAENRNRSKWEFNRFIIVIYTWNFHYFGSISDHNLLTLCFTKLLLLFMETIPCNVK